MRFNLGRVRLESAAINADQLPSFGVEIGRLMAAVAEGRDYPIPGNLGKIRGKKYELGEEGDDHYHLKLTIVEPSLSIMRIAQRPHIVLASGTQIFDPQESKDEWCYGEISAAQVYGAYEFRFTWDMR